MRDVTKRDLLMGGAAALAVAVPSEVLAETTLTSLEVPAWQWGNPYELIGQDAHGPMAAFDERYAICGIALEPIETLTDRLWDFSIDLEMMHGTNDSPLLVSPAAYRHLRKHNLIDFDYDEVINGRFIPKFGKHIIHVPGTALSGDPKTS